MFNIRGNTEEDKQQRIALCDLLSFYLTKQGQCPFLFQSHKLLVVVDTNAYLVGI